MVVRYVKRPGKDMVGVGRAGNGVRMFVAWFRNDKLARGRRNDRSFWPPLVQSHEHIEVGFIT